MARPEVRAEYDQLAEEFELLDEILKARAASGLTQAQLAERIGTTQSAVARMENALANGASVHRPSPRSDGMRPRSGIACKCGS